LTQLLNQKR